MTSQRHLWNSKKRINNLEITTSIVSLYVLSVRLCHGSDTKDHFIERKHFSYKVLEKFLKNVSASQRYFIRLKAMISCNIL